MRAASLLFRSLLDGIMLMLIGRAMIAFAIGVTAHESSVAIQTRGQTVRHFHRSNLLDLRLNGLDAR